MARGRTRTRPRLVGRYPRPSGRPLPSIEFVDNASRLPGALARITSEVVGVDVERADGDRYYRRAALVQVGDADTCVLVDPLAVPEPQPLADLLAGTVVVLHALENDLLPLEALGVGVPHVEDTGVAAALLGLPTGLGKLLDEVLGVELGTDKNRYQRADWTQRPLSQGMIDYAAGDVLHLPELWQRIADRLDEAGRRDWYEQEKRATIELARTDTRDWTRTKGAGGLDPEQRAVLRSMWEAREAICAEHDIAPNLLLHDRTLIALAEEPATDPGEIVRRNKRPPGSLRDHAQALLAAQQAGLAADPETREASGRLSDADRTAMDRLRRRRSEVAKGIGLGPGVVLPSRLLQDAVAAAPATMEDFATAAGMRPWQQELLLEELWAVYLGAFEEE